MGDVRTALFSLMNVASVQAYVGASPPRIWRGKLPQNPEYGSLAYWVFDNDTDITQDGPSGLKESLVMVDAYSQDQDEAVAIQAAVEAILSGYKGTVGTIQIQGIFNERETDLYDDSVKAFRVSQIYRVWHYE